MADGEPVRIIQNPWKNTLLHMVDQCSDELFIMTPHVQQATLGLLRSVLVVKMNEPFRFRLLTRLNGVDIREGKTEIEALKGLVNFHVSSHFTTELRAIPNISGTVVIFDRKEAMITSASLTDDGLTDSISIGTVISEQVLLGRLSDSLESYWSQGIKVDDKILEDFLVRLSKEDDGTVTISLGEAVKPLGIDKEPPDIKDDKAFAKEYFELGLDALEKDDPDRALSYFDKALDFYPKYTDALYQKGQILADRQGSLEEALAVFKKLLDHDPHMFQGWYRLGEIQEAQGLKKEALKSFDTASKINESSSDAWYQKGRLIGELDEKPENAIRCLDYAIKLDPYHESAWLAKGSLFMEKTGDYDEAYRCINAVVRINPKNSQAQVEKGKLLYEYLDKPKEAMKAFEKLTSQNSNNQDGWYFKGLILHRAAHKRDDALRCFEKVLDINPRHIRAMLEVADIKIRETEEHQEGLDIVNRIISLDPENVEALILKGLALLALKEPPNRALMCFNDALEADEGNLDALMEKGNVLAFSMNKEKPAAECFRKVIKKDPRQARAYLGLGRLHLEVRHDPKSAAAMLKKAADIDPDSELTYQLWAKALASDKANAEQALALIDRGLSKFPENRKLVLEKALVLLNNLNKPKEALATIKKLLGKYPDDVAVMRLQVKCMIRLRALKETIQIIERCIDIQGEDAALYTDMALVQINLGSASQAIIYCEKALTMAPNNDEAWSLEGYAYQSMGRINEAQSCYRRACSINPKNRRAAEGLKRIDSIQMDRYS